MPIDTSLWTTWGTGTETQSAGTLNQTPSGVSGEYVGIFSNITYDFTNKSACAQIAQLPNAFTGVQMYLRCEIDANNAVIIGYGDTGNLFMQHQISGVTTNVSSIGWPAGTIGVKIVFDNTQGQLWFATTADGVTWTPRFNEALPITTTALRVILGTGCYQAVASPGTAKWESTGVPITPFKNLTGTGTGQSTAAGSVGRRRSISGTSTAVASASGTISSRSVYQNLTATATASSTASGTLTRKRSITAVSVGIATVSASRISVTRSLTGQSLGQGIASGTLYFLDAYASAIVNHANNVAYWRLGETAGTVAKDSSKTGGHNGTYNGNPTLNVAGAISGTTDGAANFDGVDDYVEIPDFSPTPETYYGLVKHEVPQAYYRLDEPSGTSALDSSGNTKTGTFTGGTITRSQVGPLADGNTATRFQAGYIQAPLLTAFNNSAFTVEMWVRSNGAWPAGDKQLFSCGENGGANDSLVHCVINPTNQPKLGFWFDDWDPGGAALATDTWHHIVWLFEGPSTRIQRIYVNGVQRGAGRTATGTPVITTGARSGNGIQIGRVDGASVADVTMDEVAIYPVALTPTQIAAHYAARTANGAITAEAWVKLDTYTNGIAIERRNTSNVGGYIIAIGSDGKVTWYVYTDTWHSITSTRVMALGVWHHIVGAYAGGTSLLMINGEDNGRGAGWGVPNAPLGAFTRIGANFLGTASFDGQMDEIALYNTAIPDATIQSHYRVGVAARTAYGMAVERMSGLVGRWTFDEAGTNIFDHTGNGRTGTLTGTNNQGYGGGPTGPGDMRYLGPDTMIATTPISLPVFTIEAWFYPNGVQGTASQAPAIISDMYPPQINYTLKFDGGSLMLHAGIYQAGAWHDTGGVTLVNNAWSHCVMTYDGATVRLYINTVQDPAPASYVGTPISGGTNLRMGRRWDLADYAIGYLDEVAVYNRALTTVEISEHYAKGIGTPWKIDLTGSAAGSSTSVGPTILRRKAITGLAAGSSTSTAQPTRRRTVSGASAGAATEVGQPSARRSVTGTSAATSTTTGVISLIPGQVYDNIVGASAGIATASAVPTRRRSLVVTSAGVATGTAQPTRRRSASGTSAGVAVASATITRRRSIVALTAGVASDTGTISARRSITAITTGTSTTVGLLSKRLLSLVANVTGTATTTGVINKKTLLVAASAGVAVATAAVSRRRLVTGATAGKATTTTLLTLKRALTASAGGTATTTVALTRKRSLTAVGAGTALAAGVVGFKPSLHGLSQGTTTVSGVIRRTRVIVGSAAGITTVSGTVSQKQHNLSVVVSAGRATDVGQASQAPLLSGTTRGVALLTSTISISHVRYMTGASEGVAITIGLVEKILAPVPVILQKNTATQDLSTNSNSLSMTPFPSAVKAGSGLVVMIAAQKGAAGFPTALNVIDNRDGAAQFTPAIPMTHHASSSKLVAIYYYPSTLGGSNLALTIIFNQVVAEIRAVAFECDVVLHSPFFYAGSTGVGSSAIPSAGSVSTDQRSFFGFSVITSDNPTTFVNEDPNWVRQAEYVGGSATNAMDTYQGVPNNWVVDSDWQITNGIWSAAMAVFNRYGTSPQVAAIQPPDRQLVLNEALDFDLARPNQLKNGGFEQWGNGNGPFTLAGAETADGWTILSPDNDCKVYPETTILPAQASTKSIVVESVNAGASAYKIGQRIDATRAALHGCVVSFSCQFQGPAGKQFVPIISDTLTGFTLDSPITCTGAWQVVRMTGKIDASPTTSVTLQLCCIGLGKFYIDNASLVVGYIAADYSPVPYDAAGTDKEVRAYLQKVMATLDPNGPPPP